MAMHAGAAAIEPPRRGLKASLAALLGWAVAALLLGWAWRGAEMRPWDLVANWGNIAKLGADFFPPDFRNWRFYVGEIVVTVQIAIWGTALAVACAVPL